MLDNREWAALFWLTVAFLWVLSRRDFRSRLDSVFRAAFRPLVLFPVATMLAYVTLEVWIGSKLSLWRTDLLKDTIVWLVASGLVMLFNFSEAEEDLSFRRAIRGTLGAMVFVEFFMNLVAFSLFWELLIQPVVAILVVLSSAASRDGSPHEVKKWIDLLLAVAGFALLGMTVRELSGTWHETDTHMLALQFILPVWLTLGFLPYVYFLAVYSSYESAFSRINYATSDWKARLRAKFALVTKLHFKARHTRTFSLNWPKHIASAPSFIAARRVIDELFRARRDAEQAVIDERERLDRYAGSSETDDRGHRLDRREFKETIEALRYLATCQMGWYRNRGGQYHADLIDRFRNDFTSQGLPRESGITMRVARDGQAWYAWRRTITGWCFAFGAGGPPPEEWEYDGSEPPDDVPGKDPRWGRAPFSDGANVNWTF